MYWLVLGLAWEDGSALMRDPAVVIMLVVITFIYIAIDGLAQGTAGEQTSDYEQGCVE